MPLTTPHLLFVDDNPMVLLTLTVHARAAGFEVDCAHNGLEAAAMLTGGLRPDAIVTDIEMPELDGLALIRHVRRAPALRDTPVIVFSGASRAPRNGGADAWIEKGDMPALRSALRTFAPLVAA